MCRGPQHHGGREWGGPRWRGGGWEGVDVDPTTVEAGAEKERAHDVDLAAVREAVSEAPVWTRWRSVRHWHGPDGGGDDAVSRQA
jgi:hypothetical protein